MSSSPFDTGAFKGGSVSGRAVLLGKVDKSTKLADSVYRVIPEVGTFKTTDNLVGTYVVHVATGGAAAANVMYAVRLRLDQYVRDVPPIYLEVDWYSNGGGALIAHAASIHGGSKEYRDLLVIKLGYEAATDSFVILLESALTWWHPSLQIEVINYRYGDAVLVKGIQPSIDFVTVLGVYSNLTTLTPPDRLMEDSSMQQRTPIPTGVDLDTLLSTGWYAQPSNNAAAAGVNYPEPFAGMLEVHATGAMVYQRYTTYKYPNNSFQRTRFGLAWSVWSKVVKEDSSGNIVPTGLVDGRDIAADGLVLDTLHTAEPLYHTLVNNRYYSDDFNGNNNFSLILKGMRSDTIRHMAISNVEYWDFALATPAWVAWVGGAVLVQSLLDGSSTTFMDLNHAQRRFRFTVFRTATWPTSTLFTLKTVWSPITFTGLNYNIDLSADNLTFVNKDSGTFDATTTVDRWGRHAKAQTTLHTGQAYLRIELDWVDWIDAGATTHIRLNMLGLFSNYQGDAQSVMSTDYARNVTFPALVNGRNMTADGAAIALNTLKNSYPNADATKLAGIEVGATADQTGAEIKAALYIEPDTNNLTDALALKLANLKEGYMGYFANATALALAYPMGSVGQFASIGDTDTIWSWDDATVAWVNTDSNTVGDMLKATYDPTSINGDAFARGNHTGTQLAATISDLTSAIDSHSVVAASTLFYDNEVFTASTTVALFIAQLILKGAFNGNNVVFKVKWDFAASSNLVTGHPTIGTIELAGCVIETWGNGINKHIRIASTHSGLGGSGVYEYNDQGKAIYNPGWKEIWTSESDGAGSGLDADLLDGLQGSDVLARGNHTGTQLASTISDLPSAIASDASMLGKQDIKYNSAINGSPSVIKHPQLMLTVDGAVPAYYVIRLAIQYNAIDTMLNATLALYYFDTVDSKVNVNLGCYITSGVAYQRTAHLFGSNQIQYSSITVQVGKDTLTGELLLIVRPKQGLSHTAFKLEELHARWGSGAAVAGAAITLETAADLTAFSNLSAFTMTYEGSASLPLTGGTLTGTLNGRDISADGAKLDTLAAHLADVANPHAVTAAQVGALSLAGGTLTGDLATTGLVDGRDIAVDGAKLDTLVAPYVWVGTQQYNNTYSSLSNTLIAYQSTPPIGNNFYSNGLRFYCTQAGYYEINIAQTMQVPGGSGSASRAYLRHIDGVTGTITVLANMPIPTAFADMVNMHVLHYFAVGDSYEILIHPSVGLTAWVYARGTNYTSTHSRKRVG